MYALNERNIKQQKSRLKRVDVLIDTILVVFGISFLFDRNVRISFIENYVSRQIWKWSQQTGLFERVKSPDTLIKLLLRVSDRFGFHVDKCLPNE